MKFRLCYPRSKSKAVHGKVVRIVPFGVFVEVEKGIDGLVHVSQISHERIETPSTVLNVGDDLMPDKCKKVRTV